MIFHILNWGNWEIPFQISIQKIGSKYYFCFIKWSFQINKSRSISLNISKTKKSYKCIKKINDKVTKLPRTYEPIINKKTVIVILMPSFSQEYKTVNDDDTDEGNPGQYCTYHWWLNKVNWEQCHQSIQEEPFSQIVESFSLVIFWLDEPENLEHVMSHKDVE